MTQPLISIVMASYNQGKYIDEAIQSVLAQDYPHWELIVIDGGSTDNAVEVIRRHESRLAYWVSEKDRGQSHAFNKGFAKAKGDLLTWLNSDDVLLPGALAAVATVWQKHNQPKWVAGNCVWTDPEGHVIRCAKGMNWSQKLSNLGLVGISGPTSFFSPRLLQELGPIDEDLHYAMDTELWIRFARAGYKYERVHRYLWALRLHSEAKMSGHNFADSPTADPNHPARVARREQWTKIEQRHDITPASRAKAAKLSRVLRMVSLATPLAMLDRLKFRGQHWSKCFAGASVPGDRDV